MNAQKYTKKKFSLTSPEWREKSHGDDPVKVMAPSKGGEGVPVVPVPAGGPHERLVREGAVHPPGRADGLLEGVPPRCAGNPRGVWGDVPSQGVPQR